MSEVNDKKVLALKDEIEKRRKALKKPVIDLKTNCKLDFKGVTYYLNVSDSIELTRILVELNSYVLSAKDLKINLDEVILSNYKINDWISDVSSKLELCKFRQTEKELEDLEKKLDRLLSSEKRTEMALENIENTLKNM